RVEPGLGFDDGGDHVLGNGVSVRRLLDMRVERGVGDANVRRHVPGDERQEKNAKAEHAPSHESISHGEMESQIRYRIQRPAISTTYTLRGQEPPGEFLIASGRRLHGLQEAQDPHDVLLLEDLLPRRHALGAPSQGDRLVEHRRHALAVADAQAPRFAPFGSPAIGPHTNGASTSCRPRASTASSADRNVETLKPSFEARSDWAGVLNSTARRRGFRSSSRAKASDGGATIAYPTSRNGRETVTRRSMYPASAGSPT